MIEKLNEWYEIALKNRMIMQAWAFYDASRILKGDKLPDSICKNVLKTLKECKQTDIMIKIIKGIENVDIKKIQN